MNRIVASIITLDQHRQALSESPEVYRPDVCPHCSVGRPLRHGCYYRKADHGVGEAARNPVAVLRFLCKACRRTCSRLPACIAPRRWYDWAMQQLVLAMLLAGSSVRACSGGTGRARSTVRRWRDWLEVRHEGFAFELRSRFAELGRWADRDGFWRQVMQTLTLTQAMAWLDRTVIVP